MNIFFKKKIFFSFLFFFIFKAHLFSSQFRHYHEKKSFKKNTSLSSKTFSWILPSSWKQFPSEMMRLANFRVSDSNKEEIICSLTLLPDFSKNLSLNVSRWLRQLSIELKQKTINSFIEKAPRKRNKKNLSYRFLDFTEISQNQGKKSSFFVSVFSFPQNILFVKMAGSLESLHLHRKEFFDFLDSLTQTSL